MNTIQCSSKEEHDKKLRELESFVNSTVFSFGVIAIAVFSKDWRGAGIQAAAMYFLVKEKLWLTKEQLDKALSERDKTYEDLHFCTLLEEYQKNQQELISKGVILDMWNPMYTDNPHYTENSHYNQRLDPSFNPIA